MMKIRPSDLWRLDGTVDRLTYLTLGVGLTALKVVLDYLVATRFFDREWTPLDYAVPSQVSGLLAMPAEDRYFYRAMLLVALPFIFIGVALTVRRLRSAGWPRFAVLLFFAPMPVNLIFYMTLCLVPPRPVEAEGKGKGGTPPELDENFAPVVPIQKPGVLDRTLPEDRFASALTAIVLPLPFALAFTALSVNVLQNYGWGVFLGIPFALPMISVIIYGYRTPRRLGECLVLGEIWLLLAYVTMGLFAFEGIICLVMALPLVMPIALLGAAVGYLIQASRPRSPDASRLLLALLAGLPTLIGAEAAVGPPAPLFRVRTDLEIDAPPDRVWGHVIHFDPLPTPRDWFFRTGLAYPIRAEIDGTGVGAVRRCEFSTGPFVEPIEVWDEPRLLRFAVASNPPPMREWNPFLEIHPPHLDNFLVSQRGQFLLTPLPGDRTRLEGTTWYQHHMWPAAYWRLWSDLVIHRIHARVLEHIKRSAEAAPTRVAPGDGPAWRRSEPERQAARAAARP